MLKEDKLIAEEASKIYISENVSCVDAVLRAEERIKDYENLGNIFTTKQDKDMDIHKLAYKLIEEQKEVRKAYTIADLENLIEELLDELQMVVNILDYLNIDMKQAITEHNLKLKSRNREFDKKVFEVK